MPRVNILEITAQYKIYTEGEDEEEPDYLSLTQYTNIIIASTI